MSWDCTWEDVFSRRDWGRYPPEELIRFAARHYFRAPQRADVRILEIGCGCGANLWFLAREGFGVCGMDGSPSAIAKARERLDEDRLTADLRTGDVVTLAAVYGAAQFDAVVDVACIQHNRMAAVARIMAGVQQVLKPGGRFFSMMVADGSYGDGCGTEVEPGTYRDITEGPLAGVGHVHFFTLPEIQQLTRGFVETAVEYSLRTYNDRRHDYRHWVIEGRKV